MRLTRPLSLLPALLATACVTINIYFPAAAAESAAREIVDDILRAQPPADRSPAGAPEEKRPGSSGAEGRARWLARVALDLWVSPAQAAQANLEIDTPEIRRLRASMKARIGALGSHYRSGAVGLASNGLVELRAPAEVPSSQRAQVRQLVAAENRDRQALYAAIAKANGHPEWKADIQQTFARVWVEQAPAGWWYQDASGRWVRK